MSELVISKAVSYLCIYCRRLWPPHEEFAVCPCCREETRGDKNPPMNTDEARRMAIEFAFGWYLWDTGTL